MTRKRTPPNRISRIRWSRLPLLLSTLVLLSLVAYAPRADAILCKAESSVRGSQVFDSDGSPTLNPVPACLADAADARVVGGISSDGRATAVGSPGTISTSAPVPFASALADMTATGTSSPTIFVSEADAAYEYSFMICSVGGCPSSPPPVQNTLPVLMTFMWNLEAQANAPNGLPQTGASVSIHEELGRSDGTNITFGFLTLGLNATQSTIGGLTAANVGVGVCGNLTSVGGSCADAQNGFFNQTPFLVPIDEGVLYQVNLFAHARSAMSTFNGGGPAHALAVMDPLIELPEEIRDLYVVVYAEGAVVSSVAEPNVLGFLGLGLAGLGLLWRYANSPRPRVW